MAARLNPKHDARTREKIQTSQLVNRLSEHALGKVEMTTTQVTAGLGLLKKTLPDLSAIDQTTIHEAGDSLTALLKAVDGRSRGIPKRG